MLDAAPSASGYAAIRWPGDGELPAVLTRTRVGGGSYSFVLRSLDPQTDTFALLAGPQVSSAGCNDVAWVNNELGGPGLFVVCGENGYDGWYWTWIGGIGEWRHGLDGLGNGNLGNTSRIVAHPSGAYALLVSWSGRSVYRFEAGRLNGYSDAPRFSTLSISAAGFSRDGRRALVLGGVAVTTGAGIALEYRHDEYPCDLGLGAPSCGWTDASIGSFTAAPWIAPTATSLTDVAWRWDCDGGVIVGGNVSTPYGVIALFQIEGGRDCRW